MPMTNRKSTKRRHAPPHIGAAMIIMMVMLPASVRMTVGVATSVIVEWTMDVKVAIGVTAVTV